MFNSKRPVIGQEFKSGDVNYVVGAIAPGIIIGHVKGVEKITSYRDLITIREEKKS